MKAADTAMYHAKAQGETMCSFYRRNERRRRQRMELERDLHHAIAHQQLDVHYQPQVQAASGRVCGVEARCAGPTPPVGKSRR